jgi:predicted amidophosphoribosyltransferase
MGSVRAASAVPSTAVLVDDVVTTGATLAACAAALRAAGSREVTALVFARTPGR